MGILGLGRIGKAIARRAAPFGLGVVYHGRSQQMDAPFLYYPTLLGMAEALSRSAYRIKVVAAVAVDDGSV